MPGPKRMEGQIGRHYVCHHKHSAHCAGGEACLGVRVQKDTCICQKTSFRWCMHELKQRQTGCCWLFTKHLLHGCKVEGSSVPGFSNSNNVLLQGCKGEGSSVPGFSNSNIVLLQGCKVEGSSVPGFSNSNIVLPTVLGVNADYL